MKKMIVFCCFLVSLQPIHVCDFAQAIVQCTVSWGLQLFFKRLAGKHCQLVTD